jgi:hypothetical protein
MADRDPPAPPPPAQPPARADRLAQALRANLKRRKAPPEPKRD